LEKGAHGKTSHHLSRGIEKLQCVFFSVKGAPPGGGQASRPAFEHVAVMQQSIKHGANGSDIAEQPAPVLDGA
jgi:hypothetical protein